MANQDTMAQAVFLAQLEAAKSTCKCNTCRILRRASTMMTAQFLGEPKAEGATSLATLVTPDTFNASEE